jgi:hypothetical protein
MFRSSSPVLSTALNLRPYDCEGKFQTKHVLCEGGPSLASKRAKAESNRFKAESNRFVLHYLSTGTLKCLLCEQYGLTLDSLDSHYETPQHQERHQALANDLDLGTEILRRVRFRATQEEKEIAQVICPRARNAIRVALYHYFLAPSEMNGSVEATKFFRKASVILHYSQIRDQLLLLELAVWKCECLKQASVVADDDSDSRNKEAEEAWIMSGWKQHKLEQRNSNALGIVVAAVRPFLCHIKYLPSKETWYKWINSEGAELEGW